MEFTGERVVPGQVDTDLWQEHLARYVLARSLVGGGRVLDAGCGSGYGSALLAETAKEVLAVDLSAEALEYARAHYPMPHLTFQQGDCCALPQSDAELDWVVAFEVIEHLPDAEKFLREARRVLRPKGRLLVSTPNRRFYTEEHDYHNPFHTREFDATEFEALLKGVFPHCALLTQNHVPAIAFELRGKAPAPMAAAELPSPAAAKGASEPHFLLAICSAAPIKDPQPLLVMAEGGNILRERELHIHKLEVDLKSLQESTDRELVQRLQWVEQLKAELEKKQTEVAQLVEWNKDFEVRLGERQKEAERLDRELKERSAWALELKRQGDEKDAIILNRQHAVQELEAEVLRRGEWATRLDRELHAIKQKLSDTEELLRRETALLEQRVGQRTEQLAQITETAVRLEAELAERSAWVRQLSAEANALRTDLESLLDSFWHRTGRALRLSPKPSLTPPSLRPTPKGEEG